MSSKQAACHNCRRSKIKCNRNPPNAPVCSRCANHGVPCNTPPYQIGRQKGVKNKRTGIEKALHQLKEAVRKPSSNFTLEHLRQFTDELMAGAEARPEAAPGSSNPSTVRPSNYCEEEESESSDDQCLADAEDPLQMLARASHLITVPNAGTPAAGKFDSSSTDPLEVHRFFLPINAKKDVGPELDPVDLGLVTLNEAEDLIAFFYANLAHTRWGLDPQIHTLDFVRSQSALLFTALLLAASRFRPSDAALAKRLLNHRQFLVKQIVFQRWKSVEIVLGLMVSLPWMHPLEHAADDDTSVYIAMAISIAVDLSLHKIIQPTSTFKPELLTCLPKADFIDARRALQMDGFSDVDQNTEGGQRLLRRRERVWIALFIQERGICFARGRPTIFPRTSLISHCDNWHTAVAGKDSQDFALISVAVLRRDLDHLLDLIRKRCDNYLVTDVGTQVAEEIEAEIEKFFADWSATWAPAAPEGQDELHKPLPLPPYVEILVTHTRLSTYSSVINHPTAPLEVKRQFRASALSSALNVMRAAIQGESRLLSMPNNTVVMICFAACMALKLSTPSRRHSARLGSRGENGLGYGLQPPSQPYSRRSFGSAWDSGIGATPSTEPGNWHLSNGNESIHGNGNGLGTGSGLTNVNGPASGPGLVNGPRLVNGNGDVNGHANGYVNGHVNGHGHENGVMAHTQAHNQHILVPSIRTLIEEAATVLSRIGSTPPHRNGAGVVYGKYLREILRQSAAVMPAPENTNPFTAPAGPPSNTVGQFGIPGQGLQHISSQFEYSMTWSVDDLQPLHFADMSNSEVTDIIMNAPVFNAAVDDLTMGGYDIGNAWMTEDNEWEQMLHFISQ